MLNWTALFGEMFIILSYIGNACQYNAVQCNTATNYDPNNKHVVELKHLTASTKPEHQKLPKCRICDRCVVLDCTEL